MSPAHWHVHVRIIKEQVMKRARKVRFFSFIYLFKSDSAGYALESIASDGMEYSLPSPDILALEQGERLKRKS